MAVRYGSVAVPPKVNLEYCLQVVCWPSVHKGGGIVIAASTAAAAVSAVSACSFINPRMRT